MAWFDSERGEIVLRIVYDGLAKVGKTQNLLSLYDSFASRADAAPFSPANNESGRTLYFDWLELATGQLDGWPLRCQVLTVPGQLAIIERRVRLLSDADAVVLVCESTDSGVRSAQLAWAVLTVIQNELHRPAAPIIVQANKQDLPNSLSIEQVRDALASARCPAPVFGASALNSDGTRASFVAALNLAREALRASLRGGRPEHELPQAQSATQLFESMLAETIHSDPVTSAALDAAIRVLTDTSK